MTPKLLAEKVVEKVNDWELKRNKKITSVRLTYSSVMKSLEKNMSTPEFWLELNDAFIPLGWAVVLYSPTEVAIVKISRLETSLGIGLD